MNETMVLRYLRAAANELKRSNHSDLLIPSKDRRIADRYPMGIEPGYYKKNEVVKFIYFLADMLE